MTSAPTGEIVMFGGEFYDGQKASVYRDLFKWNIDKSEWRTVELTA
eukprot:CAMPEP_0114012406 /NCGR_PEP_ID=MMETSP0372-20130328/9406_1 /TAXON_ID=340204 /ORGANISM="Lankesteria abbotti" /LENGTH=45 /assembly_acc=CAM_ASM_000359